MREKMNEFIVFNICSLCCCRRLRMVNRRMPAKNINSVVCDNLLFYLLVKGVIFLRVYTSLAFRLSLVGINLKKPNIPYNVTITSHT